MYDLLKGLRVVEAASFIAGPSCGLHLAQMGAEVIRFDRSAADPTSPLAARGERIEPLLGGAEQGQEVGGHRPFQPEGRELAQRLATAPGTTPACSSPTFRKRGFLGHEALKALRADLICAARHGLGRRRARRSTTRSTRRSAFPDDRAGALGDGR